MKINYANTCEITVSVTMTTTEIKQIIKYLHDANQLMEESYGKDILKSKIMDLENVYEQAMIQIETYAQGQINNA